MEKYIRSLRLSSMLESMNLLTHPIDPDGFVSLRKIKRVYD